MSPYNSIFLWIDSSRIYGDHTVLIIKHLHNYFRKTRHQIQFAILLFTFGIGVQFYLYVKQVSGAGAITILRPPGVEGFLPIGALVGWKHFLLTGQWDRVHPAAMVILGYAVLISFLVRKAFCSWFCPIGTISEWCWKFGKLVFGKNITIPLFIDLPLRSLKYLLLLFFIWSVGMMDSRQIITFIHGSYYALADVKMLYFFTRMTALVAGVLIILAVLSVYFKNFWCRYLCPYGALLGLFSMMSPTRISRHDAKCIDCGKCSQTCPSFLPVSQKNTIFSPECTGCLDCLQSCPANGALTLSSKGIPTQFWTRKTVGWLIALSFIFTVYIAEVTGHWHSSISSHEFRIRLKAIDEPKNAHPSIDF